MNKYSWSIDEVSSDSQNFMEEYIVDFKVISELQFQTNKVTPKEFKWNMWTY